MIFNVVRVRHFLNTRSGLLLAAVAATIFIAASPFVSTGSVVQAPRIRPVTVKDERAVGTKSPDAVTAPAMDSEGSDLERVGPDAMLLCSQKMDNQDQKQDPGGDSVKELMEDGIDFFIDNLDNSGAKDASVAARDEQTFYSGKCSLSVSSFQRFKMNMPGWNYKIVEDPQPGEYRYLRFAWKRTEGPGIMLQLFSGPKTWQRYYAGDVSERTQTWGHMIRVAETPPRKWEVVTRDLFKDVGPLTINGIAFSAMEGPGEAYFDHMYLGRTVEDLDRVTATFAKADAPVDAPFGIDGPAESSRGWVLPVAIGGAIAVFIIAAILAVVVVRRGAAARDRQAMVSNNQAAMTGFPCANCGKKLKAAAKSAGKSVKCPHCGKATVVPADHDTP